MNENSENEVTFHYAIFFCFAFVSYGNGKVWHVCGPSLGLGPPFIIS